MLERHLFIAASDPRIVAGSGTATSNYTANVQVGELSAQATITPIIPNNGWSLTTQGLNGHSIEQPGGINWHYQERIIINDVQELQGLTLLSNTDVGAFGASVSGTQQGDHAETIVNMIASAWAFVWPIGVPPAPGDFNADGAVDAQDLALWDAGSPLSDMDLDGQVNDLDDLAQWVANANPTDMAAWDATTDILLVSSDGDAVDTDESFGNFTLREAIAKAAATPGPDIIMVGNGVDEIILTNGVLTIGSGNDISFVGPGADKLTVSGNNISQIFSVNMGANVNISKMTLTEGYSSSSAGGAIMNQGNLVLDGIRVTDNTTHQDGGGVFSKTGSLTIRQSTFDNNVANNHGGAIAVSTLGHEFAIEESLIANNTAGEAGGIFLYGSGSGINTIVNSTISGNIAQHGAGISANSRSLSSDVMITNCTITDNTASGTNSTGGGISVGANMSVTLFNSILSGNSANTAGHADSTGLLTSASDFNLIGEANGGTPGATGAGNQFNVTNPGLAPLADNGGPTWTHALLSTSPALDAGSDSLAPATDQRGVPRPIDLSSVSNGMGGSTDIGAYEAREGGMLMMANTISSESGNAASPSTHGRDSLPIQLATMGARMAISQDADAPENEIRQIAFQHLDPLFYPDSESDEVFVEFVRKGKTWSIDSIEIKHGLEHEFAFQCIDWCFLQF